VVDEGKPSCSKGIYVELSKKLYVFLKSI